MRKELCSFCGEKNGRTRFSPQYDGNLCSLHYYQFQRTGTVWLSDIKKYGRIKKDIKDKTVFIYLYNKRGKKVAESIVDYDDIGVVENNIFSMSDKGYVLTRINNNSVRLHRMVLGIDDRSILVDHINGNKLDNRKENLRIVTSSQSVMNTKMRCDNSVGFRGISKRESGNYQARIMVDGKRRQIGTFEKIEDAIEARTIAEEKYFGEYSFSNSRG